MGSIKTVGTFLRHFICKEQNALSNVIGRGQEGPTLFGRTFLSKLKLDWAEIVKPCHAHGIKPLLVSAFNPFSNFPKRFSAGLGQLEDVKARIHVKQGTVPINNKQRPISFTDREVVD